MQPTVSIRGVSIHEAAHATAFAVLGVRFHYVTIGRVKGRLGHVQLRDVPIAGERDGIAVWAGSVGQSLLAASSVKHEGNRGDLALIERLAGGQRDLIDAWHERAVALVLDHAPAIERVALLLMARTTLSEAEVHEALPR